MRSSRETSSLWGRTDPTPVGWRCCNHQGRVAEPQHVEARDCAEPDYRARWNRESSQAESWKGGVPTSSAAVVPSGVVSGSGPAQASDPAQPNFTTIQTQACCCSDSLPAHSGDCTRGARAVNIVSYFFLLFCCIQQVGQAVLPSSNCY